MKTSSETNSTNQSVEDNTFGQVERTGDTPTATLKEPYASDSPHTRVLIVDDNRDSAYALSLLLSCEGYEVEVVYHPNDALRLAIEYQPEVLLLDIGLPEMDGYQLRYQLGSYEALRSSIFIAISGYGQEEDRARSAQAGFHFHFVKPVACDELVRLLHKVKPRAMAAA